MIYRLKAVPERLLQIFTLICLGAPAWTQEAESDVLDEIVVTATRMESSVRDVARSVSIVNKDQIQTSTQQLGLDEALVRVPGLYIQNRYNFSGDLRVSLRGFGARSSFGIRGIRVIVDGIPETLPDGQSGVDSIDLGSAQSIEVLRGPASSLYGNASGGVIAVTSELGDSDPYIEAKAAAGEFGFQQYGVKAAGQFNSADYLLNVSRTELDGHRDHGKFRGTQLNGRLGIPFNDNDRLLVALNVADQPEAQDPGGINAAQAALDPSSARLQNLQYDADETVDQQRLTSPTNYHLPVVAQSTSTAFSMALVRNTAWAIRCGTRSAWHSASTTIGRMMTGSVLTTMMVCSAARHLNRTSRSKAPVSMCRANIN
jgi:iron complex outermembrane receptor protein